MPANYEIIRHVFDGGWATDFGQMAEVGIDQSGLVRVPFLAENRNNNFNLDGGTHKIGGTTRMNSTAAGHTPGDEVVGLYDYWKGTGGGSGAQKLVVHSGTVVQAADMDGNFSNIDTGLVDGVVPSYTTFDDLLIVSASTNTDVPAKYDQSSYDDLPDNGPDSTVPNFAFSEVHKNRLWAAGVTTLPSRLYYSAHVDPETWSGDSTGFIDIDPNDGDQITGLASHKDQLWVFKGPYKGSIHRIVGSAPTGGDSFGRQTFVRGIGASWHNAIFRFKDDIGFMWSDGSIHSLNATSAYGDFNEASLSRPINTWLRDHINGNRIKYVWAATDSVRGYVLFTIPIDSNTNNNHHLLMDYRFDPPRWAHWDAFTSGCVATVVDSGIPTLFDGSNDGYVRRLQQSAKSIDTLGAINSVTTMPFLNYGLPARKKVLSRAFVGVTPGGNYNMTLSWTRDNSATQTKDMGQGGSGALLNEFELDVDVLGGSEYMDRFTSLDDGGRFRSMSMGVSNAVAGEDLQIHNIGAVIERGTDDWENA